MLLEESGWLTSSCFAGRLLNVKPTGKLTSWILDAAWRRVGGGRRASEMEAPIYFHVTTLHLAIVIKTTIIQVNKTKLKNSIFLP